jgi:hypothetical protein
VRGRERNRVAAVLLAASAATGALAGFALGALWQLAGLPSLAPVAAIALVVGATVADAVGLRPLAVGRQVPREWGRLFEPSTTALLYGARLGVGPLTILTTWWWWAATVVSASHGAVTAAATGAVFGAVRVVVMLAVARRVETEMPRRIARVRAAERRVRSVLTVACAAVVAAALLTSCSSDREAPRAARSTTTTSTTRATPTTVAPTPTDRELAAALITDPGPGFHPVDDPAHTGPLDLDAAARAEADVRAERALLQTRGFQRGYQRSWANGTDRSALVAVYRFATPDGAAAYLQDGIITATGYGAQLFDVPAVPGARGMSQAGSGPGGSTVAHAVVFTRGDRFFLVVVTSDNSAATPDDARALALKQSQAA